MLRISVIGVRVRSVCPASMRMRETRRSGTMDVHMQNESLGRPICWGSSIRQDAIQQTKQASKVTCKQCLQIMKPYGIVGIEVLSDPS